MFYMSELNEQGRPSVHHIGGLTPMILRCLSTPKTVDELYAETHIPKNTLRGILSKLYSYYEIEKGGTMRNRTYWKIDESK